MRHDFRSATVLANDAYRLEYELQSKIATWPILTEFLEQIL